ncbi:hypothetical protein [Halalkalicoccus salilacus]|uniref:hypothetical protein n=1 Tax=Halalkalicoccus sp. GCM10025704 TaxID=3252662 RepID=UPI003609E5F0
MPLETDDEHLERVSNRLMGRGSTSRRPTARRTASPSSTGRSRPATASPTSRSGR